MKMKQINLDFSSLLSYSQSSLFSMGNYKEKGAEEDDEVVEEDETEGKGKTNYGMREKGKRLREEEIIDEGESITTMVSLIGATETLVSLSRQTPLKTNNRELQASKAEDQFWAPHSLSLSYR